MKVMTTVSVAAQAMKAANEMLAMQTVSVAANAMKAAKTMPVIDAHLVQPCSPGGQQEQWTAGPIAGVK